MTSKTIEKFVKPVVTAGPHEPLSAIASLMERRNVGAVVIVESHRPVGIISDRDIALQVAAHGVAIQTPVSRVMSAPVKTVGRDDGVLDTTQTMRDEGVRRLPVVDDDGCLVGLVTLDDVLRVLSRELSNLAEGIRSEMEVV
jgi:CBS domain-containing protein